MRYPSSTYRLQLNDEFTFADAEAVLPYLDELGIGALYLSPILTAVAGSAHGYDVIDHSRVSQELGGREGFVRLADAAHKRGMGIVVDLVPNHMGIPPDLWSNRALWSALRDGADSPYALWFDIVGGPMGFPDLPAPLDDVLDDGRLHRHRATPPGEQNEQWVWTLGERHYPIAPGTENLPEAECLAAQNYRIIQDQGFATPLHYRRFFAVTNLIGLRQEIPDVFDATHAVILELVGEGYIDGLRVDHPDGLADPQAYLDRLAGKAGDVWIVVEKILSADETLPPTWPVDGATGYESSWRVDGLFLDRSGADTLTGLAWEAGEPAVWESVCAMAKRQIADTLLTIDVDRLVPLVHRAVAGNVSEKNAVESATDMQVRLCLRELIVGLDRYRAYVRPGVGLSAQDAAVLNEACERARGYLPRELHPVLDTVCGLVAGGGDNEAAAELAIRFQQVCSAVMAKGVEDTAGYRWTTLVSLCEVGGEPSVIGYPPEELHGWFAKQARERPGSMIGSSTHDSKRSDDVRARIGVISEYAKEWAALIGHLTPLAEGIEPLTAQFMWQTIAGAWDEAGPIDSSRLRAYLLKAVREQNRWTNWHAPDLVAERAFLARAERIVGDPETWDAFTAWVRLTEESVRAAVLGGMAIRWTAPGVPDTYQGCETIRPLFTDPDNRGRVDFGRLRRGLDLILSGGEAGDDGEDGERGEHDGDGSSGLVLPKSLINAGGPDEPSPAGSSPGAVGLALLESLREFCGPDELSPGELEKLELVSALARLRRRVSFSELDYRPLATPGHLWGFGRGGQTLTFVTLRTRALRDAGGWGDAAVELPAGTWTNVVTARTHGGRTKVADLLTDWPCAVLAQSAAPADAGDEMSQQFVKASPPRG